MSEPRLMTPEQMVNVWCLMTGASVDERQKEALINLLEECYKAGVRKGRAPDESTDQENYDSVTVTGAGRQVDSEPPMMCDECGHMFGQHAKRCGLYDAAT